MNRKTGEVVTSDAFRPPEDATHLYRHFTESRRIRSIPYRDLELLRYTGRDIQKMIEDGDPEWRNYVPEVAHHAALHQHGEAQKSRLVP